MIRQTKTYTFIMTAKVITVKKLTITAIRIVQVIVIDSTDKSTQRRVISFIHVYVSAAKID